MRFIVPGNIEYRSGGNAYNWSIVDELREAGVGVELRTVEGEWPEASENGRRALAAELGSVPEGTVLLIDGLVAIAAPDLIVETGALSGGRVPPAWVLAHMSFQDYEPAEARLMEAAAGVICPSKTLALELEGRHPESTVHVVRPGTEEADQAKGSEPPHIICVAALLPNKCQLLLVHALSQVKALEWTASLVGTDQADPDYAAQVREAIRGAGLAERVELAGERHGDDLEAEWYRSDLSILVSVHESFGIVVAESLAHGIPALVRAGTGAEEALGLAGAGRALDLVPGADAEELAQILELWLQDEALRQTWQDAAAAARADRRTWKMAADNIASLLWPA